MTSVLFVCVKNGGKSQMAAGLFRALVADHPDPGQWQVGSAGTRAVTTLNALSVASLADVGVDITDTIPAVRSRHHAASASAGMGAANT